MLQRVLMLTSAVAMLVAVPLVPAAAQLRPLAVPSKAPTQTLAPLHRLITPPPVTPPPVGISATLQTTHQLGPGVGGANSAPIPLGMASAFDLQTTPQRDAQGNKYGTGTITFVTGNDLAMWLNQCYAVGIWPTLTITNVSTTGTGMVAYNIPNVQVTGADLGTALGFTFRYGQKVAWTVYNAAGTAVQSGEQEYYP
jgi:hypothetical protein